METTGRYSSSLWTQDPLIIFMVGLLSASDGYKNSTPEEVWADVVWKFIDTRDEEERVTPQPDK